jgi:hypothetical protein
MRHVFILCGALGLGLVGCKKLPSDLPMKVTKSAVTTDPGGVEMLHVEIETMPGATIDYDYDGGMKRKSIDADASGRAVLDAPLGEKRAPETTVELGVVGHVDVKQTFGKPKSLYGSVTFKVERPPKLYTDDYKGSVSLLAKSDTCNIEVKATGVTVISSPGVSVTALGKTVKGNGKIDFDVLARAGDTPVDKGKAQFRGVDVPIAIALSDGTKLETKVAIKSDDVAKELDKLVEGVARGKPLAFPGDAPSPNGKAIYYGGRVIGAASKLREADRVALVTSTYRTTNCGQYKGQKTGTIKELTIKYTDGNASVYDRRTAKPVASRTFRAPASSCDAVMNAQGKGSSYDSDAVSEWLASQAR